MAVAPAVPRKVLNRVRTICLGLPETTLRSDRTAHAFEIRRRTFTWLFSVQDQSLVSVSCVVVNADPSERAALLATGHPYFGAASNDRRLGVVLDEHPDWEQIAELIVDSYRLLAPKKLAASLED